MSTLIIKTCLCTQLLGKEMTNYGKALFTLRLPLIFQFLRIAAWPRKQEVFLSSLLQKQNNANDRLIKIYNHHRVFNGN